MDRRIARPSAPAPAELAPRVLYRSDTLLAVEKPPGIIVHGDGTRQETLTDRVRALENVNADELQALQRLDRETSGIVLFSLSKAAQARYDRMMAEHAFDKRYLAIAAGRIPWDERDLTAPIGRDRHDARRMRVSRGGKPSRTHVRVLDRRRVGGRWLTLVSARLETGRKHQIRVHLADAGHPLLGDPLYGKVDERGLMLHAQRLSFTDPVTAAPVDIVSPAPARMRALFPRALADGACPARAR